MVVELLAANSFKPMHCVRCCSDVSATFEPEAVDGKSKVVCGSLHCEACNLSMTIAFVPEDQLNAVVSAPALQ